MNISLPSSGDGVPEAGGVFSLFPALREVVHGLDTGGASLVALVAKNPPASVEDRRDVGSIPGSGRSPRVGRGNPLQYSWLEYPMNRGAWRATIHGVTKGQT